MIIISYLLLGTLLKRTRKLPSDFSNSLNLFVIYVSLPALILVKVPHILLDADVWATVAMPWLMILFSASVVLLCSRLCRWSRQVTGCLLLMCSLGNTSFLGIPMVRAFFGEKAVAYAMLYDQLGSFLALSTYGTFIIALFSDNDAEGPSLQQIAVKIVTFPPFIALLTAFLLRGLTYPAPVERLLADLGATLIPVVMIAVGYQLHIRLSQDRFTPLVAGLGIKLVLSPLAALLFAQAFGLKGLAVKVAVFEAGMPPMVSAGALAILAKLAPRLTAALVGLGIFLSFMTLPLLYQLIHH